ncbi:MAG: DKNYY domain-containing protein [Patescibacteria group bacterium]|nr:DKNYY domain-containing protein [Patescibacteria group bacterium]
MKQILTVMVLISLMPILTGCAGNWKGAVMDSVKPKLQSKIINTTHWKTCQLSQKKLAFKYPDTFDECQEGYPAFTLISKTGQSCKITCLNKIRVREQNILKGQFIKNCDGQYLTQNDKVDARHNSDKDICFTHFDELLERQNTFIVGNYIKTSYGGFFKYPKSNFWVIDFMGINYGFEPEDQSRQSAIFSDYKCPSTCYSGMAQISDKLVIAMLKTLKNMKSQPNYVYAQNPIYYHEIPKNADPETFTILNYAIAKDKDHIYYYGQPVEYVDLKTFKIIPIQNGEIGIIKDKNNVYKGGSDQRGGNTLKIIDGVDPGTIKVISAEYRGFTRDKNNFYCDWHALKDVDAATFKVLDSYAARDKDNMFLCWEGKYKINPMGLEKSKDDDWLILRNKQAGYEIKFPPNWQYIDDSYGKVNSISFGEIDKTYNIEASLMHGGISVDVPEDKRDFSFDKLLKEVKEAQKGTEIIYSADRTKINGLDAVLVKAMFGTEVHFERGGKRYTVSVYPFSTNGKDNQYDVFEKMLKTFKFIDETADAVKNTVNQSFFLL